MKLLTVKFANLVHYFLLLTLWERHNFFARLAKIVLDCASNRLYDVLYEIVVEICHRILIS